MLGIKDAIKDANGVRSAIFPGAYWLVIDKSTISIAVRDGSIIAANRYEERGGRSVQGWACAEA